MRRCIFLMNISIHCALKMINKEKDSYEIDESNCTKFKKSQDNKTYTAHDKTTTYASYGHNSYQSISTDTLSTAQNEYVSYDGAESGSYASGRYSLQNIYNG